MSETSITEDELADWISAPEAYERAKAAFGNLAASELLSRLVTGLLKGAATNIFEGSSPDDRGPALVRRDIWLRLNGSQVDIRTDIRSGASKTLRFFDVRFEPGGVEKMMLTKPSQEAAKMAPEWPEGAKPNPEPAEPVPERPSGPAPVIERRGRPTYDFWEHMIIAALRAIWFEATLEPRTQADVVRWMSDWAADNGHDVGDTALKDRARRVFLAWQDSQK